MKRRRGWAFPKKERQRPQFCGMWLLREQYLEQMRAQNYADDTIKMWQSDLGRFLTWCDERSIVEPTEVTQPIIERYQRWLYYYRQEDGRPITFQTQHHILRAVKTFFRWLTRQHLTLFNPAAEIELPRLAKKLPRAILTVAEVDATIAQPDTRTPMGVRDRAILETFYSTGVRRKELTNLMLYDVDLVRGLLMVREGKGKRDRMLPIGQRAVAWIEKYTTDARPQFVVEPDSGHLFLTVDGTPHRRHTLNDLVKKYLGKAGITKPGCCHLFRHTMATQMLENGADIRFIQEMLGHSDLKSTQIYTHVSITKLQQIHHATHPAEQTSPGGNDAGPSLTTEALEALEDLVGDDDAEDEGTP